PTLRPGDPPVYADAIARLQEYLDAWAAGDNAGKNAMLEPATQASSSVPDPQLLRGEIASYQPQQRVSDDDFTLLVDLQLHLPTANESAWGEGINSRFVNVKRADASSPFLMKFASSPPLALPE
ncbi:MAG TPA: hypothetical protein VIP09_03205, partial [Dehalococcoidia bacterium]